MWIFCKMIELALFSMENSCCYKVSCLGCLMYILVSMLITFHQKRFKKSMKNIWQGNDILFCVGSQVSFCCKGEEYESR